MSRNPIKIWLSNNSLIGPFYESAKSLFHRSRKLLFYRYDVASTYRDMRWDGQARHQYWAKSSELLFQYHKLEKGLCMPGERRFFGYDPASATLALLQEWRDLALPTNDAVYCGAVETLRAYRQRIKDLPRSNTSQLEVKLDAELALHPQLHSVFETPQCVPLQANSDELYALWSLAKRRRSVRSFIDRAVELDKVHQAVAIAQMSPSACNRQPNRVHMFSNRSDIAALLELQNGNRGFGHTVRSLLVLTADASSYFDASERFQPYVDGGLFAMSLLQALQAQGIASCCLNWCVEPCHDRLAHQHGAIPENERIVMFIAIGYPVDETVVPRSPRRDIVNILIAHGDS